MVMIPAAGADAGQWDAAVSHGRNTRNHQNHHGSLPRDELEPRATSAATVSEMREPSASGAETGEKNATV